MAGWWERNVVPKLIGCACAQPGIMEARKHVVPKAAGDVLELTRGGVMHEGKVSLVLGLAGMPAEAEDVMTSRDIRLTEATGGRLHLLNISSAVSIELGPRK